MSRKRSTSSRVTVSNKHTTTWVLSLCETQINENPTSLAPLNLIFSSGLYRHDFNPMVIIHSAKEVVDKECDFLRQNYAYRLNGSRVPKYHALS